jgi:hypothetical protein
MREASSDAKSHPRAPEEHERGREVLTAFSGLKRGRMEKDQNVTRTANQC